MDPGPPAAPYGAKEKLEMKPGKKLSLALLVFTAVLITLPFINKAFHLDDTVFVWLGQEKVSHPLALGLPDHGYEGNFFHLYLDTHPPLLSSYLAVLMRLFGGAGEAAMHLGFIVFPVLAAISMFFLSRRFTKSPLVAALLLLVTPGFMVMSQSVMTDIPALSLWLAAVASYVYAVDGDDRRLLAAAAVFSSLAVLTTYQSISLLALFFLYALLYRRINPRNMMPLAVALAAFVAVIAYYLIATGSLPKLSYSSGINLAPAFIANKILATVSVVGGATVFPLFLAAGMLKGKKEYLYFGSVAAAMFLFFLTKVSSGQYTLSSAILQMLFYSAGILAIYRMTSAGVDSALAEERSPGDKDNIFLVLWFYGVLVYSLVLLPYASTRYLLPFFPPVVLMFVRFAGNVFEKREAWMRFATAAVIFTAAAGLVASIADYQLSNVYRDFAADYPQQLKTGNNTIWFAGEFGLRYYLETQGGRYLTQDDNSPVPGDYVILSDRLISSFVSDSLKNRLTLKQGVDYGGSLPVRVQDTASLAGFYDQFHGNLPYAFSRDPIETIGIYQVNK